MGTIKWELHIIAGAAAMGRQPGEVKGLPHHPATPSWAQVWIAKLPGHPLGPGARVVPRTHSALDHRGLYIRYFLYMYYILYEIFYIYYILNIIEYLYIYILYILYKIFYVRTIKALPHTSGVV